MKVLIIGSSKFPIPAVQGGAVPNLIEELIQQQEIEGKLDLECCSLWDSRAEIAARKYKETNFIWAKKPRYIDNIDHGITWFLKNICRMKRLHSIGFLFQVMWFAFYIGKILKDNNYDRVIFENSVPMLFALKLYGNKKKYAGKYYIHMHSVPRKYYGNQKEFSEAKGLISISEYVARKICADSRVSISKTQVKLMYNCMNTDQICPKTEYDRNEYLNKYGISSKKKVILFAGRLCKEKGIEEAIMCLRQLQDKDLVLVVVGANFYSSGIVSPYEKHLYDLSKEVKDQIIFTGYIDYSKMAYIYNMADIVLLPSMWDEPAGMTIIEAMACKKPVITTYSGGISEYTGEGNCILVNRDNQIIINLSESVNKLINDKEYADTLAEKGYARAIKFNKQYYYRQFIEILNEE